MKQLDWLKRGWTNCLKVCPKCVFLSPPNYPKPLIFHHAFVCVLGATTMEGDRIEEATLANSPVDEISHLALDIGGN